MANTHTIELAQIELHSIEETLSEILTNYEIEFGVTFNNIAYIDRKDGKLKVELKAQL